MIKKKCEYCGSDFKVHKYRENTAKFCKHDCRKASQYKPGFDGENKICTTCKDLKPLSEFWKGRTKCIVCLSGRNHNYYEEHKEEFADYGKEYRKKNHEAILKKEKAYRESNREQRAAANKRWKLENPDRVRELKRVNEQVRRARKSKLPHDLTEIEWLETLEYFNHECVYCGSKENIEMEHLYSVANGGGYTKNNIVPGCSDCNKSKGRKNFDNWYITHSHFTYERLNKIIKFIEHNTEESPSGNRSESVESRGSLML